jgi:hypothetical protein
MAREPVVIPALTPACLAVARLTYTQIPTGGFRHRVKLAAVTHAIERHSQPARPAVRGSGDPGKRANPLHAAGSYLTPSVQKSIMNDGMREALLD